MAKIVTNKIPKGYHKMPDGKIMKDSAHKMKKGGSYPQKGLWDNIRANKGSGKTPTKSMLKQEKKIKASTKKKK